MGDVPHILAAYPYATHPTVQSKIVAEQEQACAMLAYILSPEYQQQRRQVAVDVLDLGGKCIIIDQLSKFPSEFTGVAILDIQELRQSLKVPATHLITRDVLDKENALHSGDNQVSKGIWFSGQALTDWWLDLDCKQLSEYLDTFGDGFANRYYKDDAQAAQVLKKMSQVFPLEVTDHAELSKCYDTQTKKELCCFVTAGGATMVCFLVISAAFHVLAAVPYELNCFLPETTAEQPEQKEYVFMRKRPWVQELDCYKQVLTSQPLSFFLRKYMSKQAQQVMFPATVGTKVYRQVLALLGDASASCSEFEQQGDKLFLTKFDQVVKSRERTAQAKKDKERRVKEMFSGSSVHMRLAKFAAEKSD